jgi:predicted nucleotidyltransferase
MPRQNATIRTATADATSSGTTTTGLRRTDEGLTVFLHDVTRPGARVVPAREAAIADGIVATAPDASPSRDRRARRRAATAPHTGWAFAGRILPAMNTVTRAQLIDVLRRTLQATDAVDAAWEGGSAAFGNADALSDVDVVAVVADDAVEASFERLESALGALSPVTQRHDITATAGFAQRFYRLRDAGEFLVVDLVLIRRSDPLLFREVELHGRGETWFDRRGILVEAHLDPARDHEQALARVPALAAAFAMFQHIVTKERRRGRAVDALTFYQAMTLRPLAEALRLLHCPKRRVFGLRYLGRDLPAETCAKIETLAFVRDLDDLGAKHEAARLWFDRCIDRLQRLGPGSGLAED